MTKIKKHMLLEFERLGVGIVIKIHRYSETLLGPESARADNSGVLFNTYGLDVLIENKVKYVTVTVVQERGEDDYERIDWGTSRDSGSVTVLDKPL